MAKKNSNFFLAKILKRNPIFFSRKKKKTQEKKKCQKNAGLAKNGISLVQPRRRFF